MLSLRELQDAVRRSMIEHDDVEAVRHIIAAGIAPQDRLSVYRNTFVQTLVRALRLSYPAVDRLVGVEFFDAAAHDFIIQHPPHSGFLDEFGDGFGAFLDRFAPAASVPYLGDVARLEWAVSGALHAPDAPPLSLASLGTIDTADQARIRFIPQPSVSLVRTAFPADVIWRAVLTDATDAADEDHAALAAIDLESGPAWLFVQRGASGVETERVDEARWRFVDALCAGHPLGAALAAHPGIDAPAALADLLARGCFAGFSLADAGVSELSGRSS